MNMIEIKNLKKSYGHIEAVKGISFEVGEGQLFAFLGCNGAGKSTTIDMLCTFLKPDGGHVKIGDYILGKEDERIKQLIGIVFQDHLLDDLLTVEENLITRSSLYFHKKDKLKDIVYSIMKEMGIENIKDRLYGTLSGGQKRRCDIARALIHQPRILFLDEPTTGLDPQTRNEVWKTIIQLQKKNNMTIFLTTHYMEEAMNADYVVVMDEGKIVAKGTPLQLRKQYTKDKLKLIPKDKTFVEKLKETYIYQYDGRELTVMLDNTFEALPLLNKYINEIEDFEVIRGNMDDAFIEITGKELEV
ncbi:MAG: ABC transporter ATP-binding protein [Erysipelotrichales bacterium]|nr:ABC transporter ATP-binding protein [Erysipelotrichales bacterium]